ncbi:endoplasmic reticulum-Golgi intermediate compartment protein 3-like protein [Tanacetum coccineum]
MERVFSKVRNLDAYPKINEDFYSRTLSGGVITLVSSIAMFLLFFSELGLYLHTVTESKLVVDTSRGEKLHINFDITFPAVSCTLLSLDAMDISGEQHLDIRHDVFKKRLGADGKVIEERKEGIGGPQIDKPLQRHGGRLEHNETYCGSCFGAESTDHECCNSCEEVREAYRRKGWGLTNPELIDQCKREGFAQKIKDEAGEGCNIYGSLEVNKVAGNFHFIKSFHQSSIHLPDMLAFQEDSYNVGCQFFAPSVVKSEKSEHLSEEAKRSALKRFDSKEARLLVEFVFGENEALTWCTLASASGVNDLRHYTRRNASASTSRTLYDESNEDLVDEDDIISHKINKLAFGEYYPGIVNPLDGVQWYQEIPNGMYQYFIKVVPTIYTNIRGHTIQSNQFSVTEHYKGPEVGRRSLPGVFFFYDLSPIKVTFTETHASFLHFMTNVCAIVGGIFTVAGIVDSFVYHGHKVLRKKMEIGKLG